MAGHTKYYVMLIYLDPSNPIYDSMYVPIKACVNPHSPAVPPPGTPKLAFCSGMPQFFGGTVDRTNPYPALQAEVRQESRNTCEIIATGSSFFSAIAPNTDTLYFYYAVNIPTVSQQWNDTSIPWGSASNRDEAEIDRLVWVNLSYFNTSTGISDDQIITELIRQTNSLTAPPQGQNEFYNTSTGQASFTAQAFIALIRLYLSGSITP